MTKIHLSFALIIIVNVFSTSACAEDASFPCINAKFPVEIRVCQSPYATLKKLDRDLSKWYRKALASVNDKNSLKKEQLSWLKSLEECIISKHVEPKDYVCKLAKSDEERMQCYRDFCLANKYSERIKILFLLPTQGKPGRYVLSDRWPNGIHENVDFMTPENTEMCKSIEATLSTLGPLSGPLTRMKSISESLDQASVSWVPIETQNMLPMSQQLEKALRLKWHHDTDVVDSKGFLRQLFERIASGEITIALATKPAFVDNQTNVYKNEPSVLRYQRWALNTKTTDYDKYDQIEFFRVDSQDLSTAQIIGSADDVFVLRDRLYFYSISERGFDDDWEVLPISQPELFVYTLRQYDSVNTSLVTACHFLFTQ